MLESQRSLANAVDCSVPPHGRWATEETMLLLLATAAADDTPICKAIERGDVEEVRRLVQSGVAPSVFCDWAELEEKLAGVV